MPNAACAEERSLRLDCVNRLAYGSASHRRLVFDQLRLYSHSGRGRLALLATVGAAATLHNIPHAFLTTSIRLRRLRPHFFKIRGIGPLSPQVHETGVLVKS